MHFYSDKPQTPMKVMRLWEGES